MKNEDTRVQYTKSRFHAAMIELLEQKPIGFISIKELCDAAGLNRGTFYLHYAEPNDVLREIETELLEKTIGLFETEQMEPYEKTLLRQTRVLWDNRRVAAAAIGHNGNPNFLRSAHDRMYLPVQAELMRCNPESDERSCRMRYDYLFSGCTGVIIAWLSGEIDGSPEDMAKLLSRLCESVWNTNL